MSRRRPPRLATALYLGVQRYFLTICCDERRPSLHDPSTCDLVLLHLRRSSEEQRFAVFAYCMMPDHLHLVAEGQADDSDCLAFVRRFKQETGFAWKKRTNKRLWQNSFYDHVLRDEESTRDVVRYTLENPVRVKLVVSPGDYEHSGSLVYERAALLEWAFGSNSSAGGV